MPSISPSETTSMVARIGAPTAVSVTPRCASTSVWPAAVAPPCEPMAGTMKGSNPEAARRATMPRTSTAMSAMPRLPTATAMLAPGASAASAACARGHSASSAASASTAGKTSKCCRTSNMAGRSASSPATGPTTNGYVIPTSKAALRRSSLPRSACGVRGRQGIIPRRHTRAPIV